jgi:hypothetical protein
MLHLDRLLHDLLLAWIQPGFTFMSEAAGAPTGPLRWWAVPGGLFFRLWTIKKRALKFWFWSTPPVCPSVVLHA